MSEKGSANLRFAEDAFEESRVVGAQDFLYGQKYDSAIKQGLRTQMGLTEILDSGDCKEAWERCGAEEAATATDGPGQAGADNEEADSYPLAGSVAAPGQLDKYVPDEDDLVQEAEEETVAEVDSYLSLVSCSHGGEEKSVRELAGELRALSLNAVRGSEDSAVLIIYDSEAAGEQKNTTRKSPTPLRKEHLEAVVKAVVCSRQAPEVACFAEPGENDPDLPAPHGSDL